MVTAWAEREIVVAHAEESHQRLHSISGELPLLSLSGMSPGHAAWMGGFFLPVARIISLALHSVRIPILSTQTVPGLTTSSNALCARLRRLLWPRRAIHSLTTIHFSSGLTFP